MRIDAYNQIGQVYQAAKPKRTAKMSESSVTEKYEVSKSGKDYQIAKNALSELPDVREDKVRDFKEALASGAYNVSSQEIAESMVSKFFDSIG